MGINLRLTDFVNVDIDVSGRGSGGVGLVYWGPDRLADGRWRALKTLRPNVLNEKPEARAEFIREALAWMSMWPHPNLVPAEGIVSIDNQQYIVLTYAEHGSLRNQIRPDMPLATALRWAQMIAAGLDALHAPDPDVPRGGVSHGNLKPENVLIHETGVAQLSDFGLATVLNDHLRVQPALESSASRRGTFAYMAPEQWTRTTRADCEADMYAFGIILYELLTGEHPFPSLRGRPTKDEWRKAHEQDRPGELGEHMRGVPDALDQLVQRCLSKHPQERPTASEAYATLQRIARQLKLPAYVAKDTLTRTPANQVSVWGSLATTYAQFGYFEEALRRVNRVLAIDAHNATGLGTRANVLAELGRVNEALHAFDAALAARSPHQRSYTATLLCNRATMLGKVGRFAEADAGFARALGLVPADADVWHQRAANQLSWAMIELNAQRSAEGRSHLGEGIHYAEQALNLAPDDPQTDSLLFVLQHLVTELQTVAEVGS